MRQPNASAQAIAALEVSGNDKDVLGPLLTLMQQATSPTKEPLPFQMVRVEILLSSYQAFIWQNVERERGSCHLLALHFAHEVQTAMRSVATTIFEVHDAKDKVLQAFEAAMIQKVKVVSELLRELRFDLYNRSRPGQSIRTSSRYSLQQLGTALKFVEGRVTLALCYIITTSYNRLMQPTNRVRF